MIEFKIRWPTMEPAFKDWTHFHSDWPEPTEVNFVVYMFRINGKIYDQYNEDFSKAFKGDVLWSKLKNENVDEWLNAYMVRTDFERENATEIVRKI